MMTMTGTLITLEPLNIDKHAEGYWRVCQDAKIHKYAGKTTPVSIMETAALLKKYEEYFLNWMIISNETHEVIGLIRLGKPGFEDGILTAGESEFLASPYWRKGHMKEAKKLFYPYVFDTISVEVLYADVWEGNTNSIESLKFYGYQLIESKIEFFPKTGKDTLKHIFRLTKHEYRRRLSKSMEPSQP